MFNVTQPNNCTCVPVLNHKLDFLINLPDKEKSNANLPEHFLPACQNTSVITDCTEVFIKSPSTLTPGAQTWSNYKNQNTFKVFMALFQLGLFLMFLSVGMEWSQTKT